MKRALVLALAVVIVGAMWSVSYAGPYLGLRYAVSGDLVPVLGAQTWTSVSLFTDAAKLDFWDGLQTGSQMWEGVYEITVGISVPLTSEVELPIGASYLFEAVNYDPGAGFEDCKLVGFTGLWYTGRYGNKLRLDVLFDGDMIWPMLGFHLDLFGLGKLLL